VKDFVDIHVLLSTPDDMEDVHDDPYEASEKLNTILHLVFDHIDDDEEVEKIHRIIEKTWEHWHLESYLLEIEVDDLVDFRFKVKLNHLRLAFFTICLNA
jgi:hypothetical protein